ncbi:MAG: PLP-dependent transferase [Buchananella hordeovulneris]|nr:PLP-dependent transferase [Buchananella hordeovulneris]
MTPTAQDPTGWGFTTRQIHAGQDPAPGSGACALPIYQSAAFVFDSAEQAAARFRLEDAGPVYTRIGNPTLDVVEKRIANLEGGVGALLTSSGQAAETLTILNLARAGKNLVVSRSIYGGTRNLFTNVLPQYGITAHWVEDSQDPASWKAAADENTVAFYGETVPNPTGDVFDIAAVANAAHEVGVPLILDNTVGTPYLIRPFEYGADIVVHSATKYLGGHGSTVAGVIVDSGNFDYAASPERFPGFNEPDPSYHGLVYARDLGVGCPLGANLSFILRARVQLQRDLGMSLAPFNAFLLAQGIETLSLRMERHLSNTHALVKYLESHPAVESVRWASLPSSPYYEVAQRYFPKGASALFAFDIKGGLEAGRAFVESTKLFKHLVNIGDVRSLVSHPASTTHSQLTTEQLQAAGIGPGTLRLSVGLEDPKDLIADLEQALAAGQAAAFGTESAPSPAPESKPVTPEN